MLDIHKNQAKMQNCEKFEELTVETCVPQLYIDFQSLTLKLKSLGTFSAILELFEGRKSRKCESNYI